MEQAGNFPPLRSPLADFICRTTFEALPADIVHQAKLCLLDLIGVGLAGAGQNVSGIARRLIPFLGAGGAATLWGSDQRLPAPAAAFLNGVQGHAIDMDDGHRFANGHPGVVTIPAAVALAEQEDLTGRELIEAVVVGYELFIRLGRAANPELLTRGFHTTATIGCLASGAAAAKLLGLSPPQVENALSLAGLQCAGLLEVLHSGESGKSFQVGKAAQSGVLAALMAQHGADGPEMVFESPKGIFPALAGKPCDGPAIARDLGREFGLAGVYFKKHAACRHIHAPLDAVAALMERQALPLEAIEAIEVETYSVAQSLTGQVSAGDSAIGAKFSIPVAVSLLLVFGRTDDSVFAPRCISDPRVQSLARKVRVRTTPERDRVFPRQRGALVTVHVGPHAYAHEVTHPRGEPENPLGEGEMRAKFEQNAGTLYPAARVDLIRDLILDIENRKIRELGSALRER
jgi:2-methylcitrate dehydratase PrpD